MLRNIIDLLNTLEEDINDEDIIFARGGNAIPRTFKEAANKIKQRHKWKNKDN